MGNCGLHAQRYLLLQNSTVKEIRIDAVGGGTQAQLYVGIYDDASGEPGNRLVTSDPISGTNDWQTVDIQDTFLTAGYYWLVIGRVGSAGFWSASFQTNMNIQARDSQACTSDLPSVFPASVGSMMAVCIEAVYCSTVPAVTSTMTLTPTATPLSTPVGTCGYYGQTQSDNSLMDGTSLTFLMRQGLPGGYARLMRIHMASANADMQVGLYTDNNGVPGDLLTVSASQAVTAGWNVLDIPDVYLGSGYYWMAWSASNASVAYRTDPYAVYRYFSGVFTDPCPGNTAATGGDFAMDVQMCP
jgi:hypothetical protein